MEKITFAGLKELSDEEKVVLNEISSRYYPKLETALQNEVTVNVHIKVYKPKQRRKKYSVTLKVTAPTTKVFRVGVTDWILQNALVDAYNSMVKVIKRHFKKV